MRLLKPDSFLKNIVTLTTGTTIAQAIPALISPVLTRLYSPEDFGLLALFVSITSLFSVIVTGKYELAIILPDKEENAKRIVRLSLILTLYASACLLIIFFIGHQPILYLIKDKRIGFWLYLIPVAVFFSAAFEVYRYYAIRRKAYRSISESSVIRSGTASAVQVVLGVFNAGALGLLLGNLLSLFTGNLKVRSVFLKNKLPEEKVSYKLHDLSEMANRYKNFPKLTLPSLFFNTASVQLPIFLFSTFFSSTVAGFYSLTQRVLHAPMTILGTSVGQVYFQKANEYKSDPEKIKNLTWGLYKKLLWIGIFPLAALLFFGPDIFSFIFGDDWAIAGNYGRVLSFWFFFTFISSPISNLFFILEKQKQGLYFQIILFVSRALVLFSCIMLGFNAYRTVLWFGVTGAILFFGFIFYLLALAGQKKRVVLAYTLMVVCIGLGPVYLIWKLLWI